MKSLGKHWLKWAAYRDKGDRGVSKALEDRQRGRHGLG